MSVSLQAMSLVLVLGCSDEGPSMAETKRWLETEAPAMLGAFESQLGDLILSTSDHSVANLALENCVLSWTSITKTKIKVQTREKNLDSKYTYRFPLRYLDLGGVRVDQIQFMSDKPADVIRLPARSVAGATIISVDSAGKESREKAAMLYVRSRDEGQRVVKAIRRAAQLCGAPANPF